MRTIDTEILVCGAGAAGIRATAAACHGDARAVMVAAGEVAWGGATFSGLSRGWGIQTLQEKNAPRQTDYEN